MKSGVLKFADIDPRFKTGLIKLGELARYPRYQAAFIFGSVAEGTSSSQSDLDVKVIVDEDSPCDNINHPTFDAYKLDITFRSFKQIEAFTENEIRKAEREPNLVRGVIIFDKTGELTKLQTKVQNVQPQKYSPRDYQHAQFMLYHADSKVERFLNDDPAASLYSMHANLAEVLKIHFKLHGKWWVSSKNILRSLDEWDKKLAILVKNFIAAANSQEKYAYWSAIIDYVARPMGGRQPISENNCDCDICQQDLAALH